MIGSNRKTNNNSIIIMVLFLGMLILTLSASLLMYSNMSVASTGGNNTDESESYLIHLTDMYDSANEDTSEKLILDDKVSSKLNNLHNELKNNNIINYQEVVEPSVYYIGDYKGKETTIDGGERNQTDSTEGEQNTGLLALQLPKNMSQQLSGDIEKGGAFFADSDYKLSSKDEIPVILGSDYSDIFSVGDTFTMRYYFEKMKCKVIGFFKNDTYLGYHDQSWEMNHYILFPQFSNLEMDYDNTNMVLMDKCDAYISASSLKELKTEIKEIKRISQEYDFKYDIQALNDQYDFYNELEGSTETDERESINTKATATVGSNIIYIILSIVGLLLTIIYILGIRKECLSGSMNRIERSVISKTKKMIKAIVQILATYTIAYILTILILNHVYATFYITLIQLPNAIIRLWLIAMIVISGVVISRSTNNE